MSEVDYNGKFADDDKIEENKQLNLAVKKQQQPKISLSASSLTKAFRVSSSLPQNLPVQVTLVGEEFFEESAKDLAPRPNVDLVCVIDTSGSMSGEKIALVRETLLYILEQLGEGDRLCLISFNSSASRLTHLMTAGNANKNELQNKIRSLDASGSTNIQSGLDLAFRTLQSRKYRNPVSSVLLLSDGQDDSLKHDNVGNYLSRLSLTEVFTVNCFGFGAQHDAALMNEIAKFKDGALYFVENLQQVEEMFVDALGGLFSVIATQVEIRVRLVDRIFEGVRIVKTYGEMWTPLEPAREYAVRMIQLISGV